MLSPANEFPEKKDFVITSIFFLGELLLTP